MCRGPPFALPSQPGIVTRVTSWGRRPENNVPLALNGIKTSPIAYLLKASATMEARSDDCKTNRFRKSAKHTYPEWVITHPDCSGDVIRNSHTIGIKPLVNQPFIGINKHYWNIRSRT